MNTCQTVLRVPVCVRGARSLVSLSPVPVTSLLSLKAKGCDSPGLRQPVGNFALEQATGEHRDACSLPPSSGRRWKWQRGQ